MDASVAFLLDNVKDLVLYHITLHKEAKNELMELQSELELMKAKLKQVSDNRDKSEVFSVWERKIRDVVYDVEDVIDECVIQIAAEKAKKASQGGIFSRKSSLSKIITKTKLAEKIKDLRLHKVKKVFDEARNAFAEQGDYVSHSNTGNQILDKRNKVPRDNIVGFEDEIVKIIEYLKADSEKMEVTTISGMPGLGKSTVAWKIFKDPTLEYEFPTRIWVNVSQEFNKIDVLLQILNKFTAQDMSGKTELELVQEIKPRLESGPILLFLDDVWTSEDWYDIKSFLPENNKTCKVLITTRHENVGWHANHKKGKGPHKLRILDFNESWELLQLEIGVDVFADDTLLSGIGKHIAMQCEGLPLSIIIIGGIMIDKIANARGSNTSLLDDWKKISESVETSLNRDDSRKQMENIISLSYTKLPYDFRDCFLYLGMFPSGTEIPAWKLTRLWIAEGFVQEESEKTLEQVAEDILKELITRNLLMVRETKMNGNAKICRVHDTIREFCKNKSNFKNENLFQEIKMSKVKGVFEPPLETINVYRRLSIHSHIKDLLTEKIKVPKARSFLCFAKDDVQLEVAEIQPIADAFSLLRVFEANTIKFPKFPSDIVKLHHLRYVTLCVHDLEILPPAISDLWNLQTITVETTKHNLDIQANLWSMVQLRNLKTKASIVLSNKNEKGKGGPNMQTLTMLSTQSCTDNVFDRVKYLTALGISGDLPQLLKSKSFETLTRLEKLKLVNKVYRRAASENPLTRLPETDKFPPNLKVLTLSETHLEWKNMSALQNLANLMVLKLKNKAFMGHTWNAVGSGFPLLETLYIERTNLEFWTISGDAFPRLKNLVFKNCEKLTEAPFSQLKSLEKLKLERVTPSAVSSAMKTAGERQALAGEQGTTKRNFQVLIALEDKPPRS